MEVVKLVNKCEEELKEIFSKVDRMCEYNSLKVLNAFNKCKVSASDFNGTTGYGYDDIGRDKIEDIFSLVLGGEDSLVRSQIISGTHAISIALFGILRPNDTIVSIIGKPYDKLEEGLGIKENKSSL
ncbi:MAG: methionine gamma-lyase family protein [Bacilli bacterium]|nr:methionine gamma-lyase family protein [Bacilli bacterium]